MSMRRLIIVRKDLNLKPGKLAAMVGHLCESYWTNLIKKDPPLAPALTEDGGNAPYYRMVLTVPRDVMDNYVFGIFTKTVCEAKNLNDLKKVDKYIDGVNKSLPTPLTLGVDYGYIRDNCLTDLKPEDSDGRTTIGVWFRPLPDEIAHKISKKYKLYRERSKIKTYVVVCNRVWDESEDCITYDRYTSLDEAKKHLNYLFKKFSEDKDYADVKWEDSGDSFTAEYKLFKYRNVETYEIIEEDIEVKDKFDESKEG